mmetsp:Transcript_37654/g.61498  ORF Transcript_37654/g.61498 Transcript_37654/m.61498 type:complete len:228 (+) Transcript_37654:110-793(+)
MSKKRAPGDFTPSQFASCIENGLNIHVHDKLSAAAAKVTVNQSSDEDMTLDELLAIKTKTNPTDTSMQPVGETEDANNATEKAFPRAECTNGAMEALRLCHSAFLSSLSRSLGELELKLRVESSSSKKGKSASTTRVSTTALTEKDVMTCMEQMGLSNIAQRAMSSLASDDSTKQPRKKKRKMKDHFANLKGTQLEELLAEQERLLSESAHRVQMMNHEPLQGKSEE